MADQPKSGNPWLDAWLAGQKKLFEAQGPLPFGFAQSPQSDAGSFLNQAAADAVRQGRENWEVCQRQANDWIKVMQRWMGPPSPGEAEGDSIAEETLRRMLDPTRFLYAGTDEVNQAIQRLVEGPEFADIGQLERQTLKATGEWIALREASAAYRVVTATAWQRAFATFTQEMTANPAKMSEGPRAVLDRWLEIANEEMIRTQRTDEFLDAQRRMLAAGVNYRLKERELVEVWCETHSIPTRTEVDDLHRIVHELTGQVRELQHRLAATEARPDRARRSASGGGAKSKTS